jgi:UDP-hydrolysing UDP-N-acetyl-D-glucosamine 2-epimerase
MKFKILVFTSSRSDFGPLQGVLLSLLNLADLNLLISGAHTLETGQQSLSEVQAFCTKHNIKSHLIPFDYPTTQSGFQEVIANAKASEKFGEYLTYLRPDLLMIIGDRWELFSISVCAFLMGIPIAHISGGETTFGAIDDSIRHVHTKLSSLHFVACQDYATVVSLLGEEDWRITISGESGLDWMHYIQLPDPGQVWKEFDLPARSSRPLLLVTYHPTSYGNQNRLKAELSALSLAIASLNQYEILITGPGLEQDAGIVREQMLSLAKHFCNIHYVEHLGRTNYLALMHSATAVIGNSSSGIVEAPSLGVPSLDIGNRQKGRIRAASVDHCGFSRIEILERISHVTSDEFRRKSTQVLNPYDPYRDGKNCHRIAYACIEALESFGKSLLLAKGFDQTVDPTKWDTLLKKNELCK